MAKSIHVDLDVHKRQHGGRIPWGWKSPVQPDGGEARVKRKGVAATSQVLPMAPVPAFTKSDHVIT